MWNKLCQYVLTSNALQRARWSTTAIMILAATESFDHQRAYLFGEGAATRTSIIVPITIDLLAITCNIIVHIPDVSRVGFWISMGVLIVAVGVSGTANFFAADKLVLQIANLWTVAAYLLSEFVTASAKAKVKADEQQAKARPVKTEAERLEARRRRAGYDQMTSQQKADWTREDNRRQAKRKDGSVPVSPAGPTKEMVPSVRQLDEIAA